MIRSKTMRIVMALLLGLFVSSVRGTLAHAQERGTQGQGSAEQAEHQDVQDDRNEDVNENEESSEDMQEDEKADDAAKLDHDHADDQKDDDAQLDQDRTDDQKDDEHEEVAQPPVA